MNCRPTLLEKRKIAKYKVALKESEQPEEDNTIRQLQKQEEYPSERNTRKN